MSLRISQIIENIRRPLLFASKDGFAHLHTVKGLEHLMEALSLDALSLEPSGEIKRRFDDLKNLFKGFDLLDIPQKKNHVARGLYVLDSILKPDTLDAGLSIDEVIGHLKKLSTPLDSIKGIGPRLAERLNKKGLKDVEDVLYFLPIRYEDRRDLKKIAELTLGAQQIVRGSVLAMGESSYKKRKLFEMAISDGTGILKAKWFNYKTVYMKKRFKVDQKLILFGQVTAYGGQKEMIHPEIEVVSDDKEDPVENGVGSIVPVYSQLENLYPRTIRKLVGTIVDEYAPFAVSGLSSEVVKRRGLMPLKDAFMELHKRGADSPCGAFVSPIAKKTLMFEELFLLELGLALKRKEIGREKGIAFSIEKGIELEKRLVSMLSFKLTSAQGRVIAEIKRDMAEPHPMNRLIQGDVGSGKTIVSFIAVLISIGAGFQSAIMAPTEILAEQHYLTTKTYAETLGIRTLLLTSRLTKAQREKALGIIRQGETDLVIGTHALIQRDVEFQRLGLCVVDEQHRFGVVQRALLKRKGLSNPKGGDASPDILVMTATPIPRTLAMTVFGDMDVSIIDEMPPGRRPVETRIFREAEREKAYSLIRNEVRSGGQTYIIYPLVKESEELSLKDATNMKLHLERDIFPEFRLGLLHGRLKSEDKERVMRGFKDRNIDILVATTVIEVGVDVPDASVILIEHAERFGLSQLHQLRGRVGRGARRSFCFLLAQWTNSDDALKRLKIMEETSDGFVIAEEDLKIRGPGDFLGTRQSGLPDFRTSAVFSDLMLLKSAREDANLFLEKDPELKGAEAMRIMEVLRQRWEDRLELAGIG
ncbi:MAG: ATP-dependent DNA helicase RecG [Deltaproteobacteria bacterium]|nr:ATP-dependent DNA helicase RecG [Deltaproteobacteria bacterium]